MNQLHWSVKMQEDLFFAQVTLWSYFLYTVWLFPDWKLKSYCKCKLIVVVLLVKPSHLWIRELSSAIIPCIRLRSILVAKDHWEKNYLKLNYFDYNLLPLHTVWSSWECIMALVIYIIARINNKTVVLLLAKPSHLSEYAN